MNSHEIEAAICGIMIEHDTDGTFANRDADPGKSFSILWTHTLQDNAGHLDRRASKASTTESRLSGIGNYEVMLARPLFLLLDALLDERTQLFMTVRTWLQSLVGLDKYVMSLARERCSNKALDSGISSWQNSPSSAFSKRFQGMALLPREKTCKFTQVMTI
jgi:hypothetical protein